MSGHLQQSNAAAFRWPALWGLALAAACSNSSPPTSTFLTRDDLLDPTACQGCHQDHYEEWAGSMHAYAADDPVFIAMNKRGQRETNGALGTFCVNCHAPMAVNEKATTDGLNLADVPQSLKGVTCYFCHSIDQVTGTHDAQVHLAGDLVIRGELSDAVANSAHNSGYSAL